MGARERKRERESSVWYVYIVLQHYRIHMDVGISKSYLGFNLVTWGFVLFVIKSKGFQDTASNKQLASAKANVSHCSLCRQSL